MSFYYLKRKGDREYYSGNYKSALKFYKEALDRTKAPSKELLFNAAFCATKREAKDSELAISLYRSLVEIDPHYPYALNNLGYELFVTKNYDAAEHCLKLAIELDEDTRLPCRNLFAVLKKCGKINELKILVEKYPNHFTTKYYREELKNLFDSEVISNSLNKPADNKHSGFVSVVQEDSNISLYPHQKDALKKLTEWSKKFSSSAGLLVLPTGGGKTLTATWWLMQNVLSKSYKVIWLAHRHALLEQAKDAFKRVCYKDISHGKSSYKYRIISGQHDRTVNIKSDDDILIASKSSLARSGEFLRPWIQENADKIYLVIDEAHHAPAKEYRDLIAMLKNCGGKFHILGLTATPFRTAENEQGLLKKLFPDDIIYKIDLHTLIERGILADPIFHSIDTAVNMAELFRRKDSDDVLRRIVNESAFDLDNMEAQTAKLIAEHSERNHIIVDTYVKNRELYGKTLVFALNRDMAIALNKIFRDSGVRSDFVISGTQDSVTKVSLSSKDNVEKIQKFKDGKLDVLVNVNILTEGTDLPEIQTVFLTRPTKSTILMTQMIGRALRGKKAGGTDKAYIVNFIDNWQEQIAWVNPEKLFIDENAEFKDSVADKKYILRLISIAKLEEFAKLANDTLDPQLAEEFSFLERIPLGFYQFSYVPENSEDEIKNCTVLVYDCMKSSYEDLMDWLRRRDEQEISDVDSTARHIDEDLFGERDKRLGYNVRDIYDILKFYNQTRTLPQWVSLEERKEYDPSILAQNILNQNYTRREEDEYIQSEWERADGKWIAFFGYQNINAFTAAIDSETRRLMHPDRYKKPEAEPVTEFEKFQMKNLSLNEIREENPVLYEKIREYVYKKFQDDDGFYFSAQSNHRSKNRLDFEIDHIKPMARGGLTELDNLQLLTLQENRTKGAD